jgi:hypothetical protein
MVSRGAFILHDAVRPALPDGAYELKVTQQIDPLGQSVDALDKHLFVTGPRFAVPPDQPLSSYPPANASGDFSTRLPQIVLRRRTLPWERYIDAGEPTLPWLALVVLADGEGQLTTGQPVDTTGLPDPDLRDSDTRDVLTVTERVVRQIFPTKQDLPWLCHVREVDLTDTELALGDDDGWLAVVLANRLPQPGVKYTACLVSLEGHGGDLPTKEVSASSFSTLTVYSQSEITAAAGRQRQNEALIDTAGTRAAAAGQATVREGPAVTEQAQTSGPVPVTLVGSRPPATKPAVVRDAWSAPALPATIVAGQRDSSTARGFITGANSVAGLSISPVFIDPEARLVEFTVLKHWSFTCSDGGDFESLVRELDDGMLGTLPPPASPATTPGTPPGAPATRPDPVVTDTGHAETAAISRRGDPGQAWYRGPFSPRQILRTEPDDSGSLPLLHAADQARRVGSDGLEDLSLAAAFEIGRLLAVSQPAVVAGLLGWRQDGYSQARVRTILSRPGGLQARLLQVLDQGRPVFSGGVAATLVGSLGTNGAQRLGPVRPLANPGPDLVGAGNDLAAVVAQGFGMDRGQVSSVLASGPASAGLDPAATAPVLPAQLGALGPADFASAQAGLLARVASLVAQSKLLGEGAQ